MSITSMLEPRAFHTLGSIESIPLGEGRCFLAGDETIAVFRTRQNRAYAVQSTCPHAGGPLADGITGDGKVLCPLHGFAFDLASGAALREGCPSLKTFPVRIDRSSLSSGTPGT